MQVRLPWERTADRSAFYPGKYLLQFRLRFEIDSPASDEQLATLLKLTERYCVILQTLRTPPRMEATLRRVGA